MFRVIANAKARFCTPTSNLSERLLLIGWAARQVAPQLRVSAMLLERHHTNGDLQMTGFFNMEELRNSMVFAALILGVGLCSQSLAAASGMHSVGRNRVV